jgi:hypothetical protein
MYPSTTIKKKKKGIRTGTGTLAHNCNPNYLGGKGLRFEAKVLRFKV